MLQLAIIGGTGLTQLPGLSIDRRERYTTPFGEPSADLAFGSLGGQHIVFLARHGDPHRFPPHRVNYRANLWALKQAGATRVLAVAAVGGIAENAPPGAVVIPDQLIDYTHGRAQTFFEDDLEHVTHIDFSWPYTPELREKLLSAAQSAGVAAVDGGVYGCTQGPRLETAAEIARMARDGCTLVGMTGMPEAALARELEMDYVCCAVVANWGAGLTASEITLAEIEANLVAGMAAVKALLPEFMARCSDN